MDGRTKDCGAVSGLSTVVHPVSLARLVMENSPHVYLGFDGAEEFARIQVQNPCYYVLLLITNRKRKGSTSYVYNGEGEARNTPKWSSQLWSRHVPKPSWGPWFQGWSLFCFFGLKCAFPTLYRQRRFCKSLTKPPSWIRVETRHLHTEIGTNLKTILRAKVKRHMLR